MEKVRLFSVRSGNPPPDWDGLTPLNSLPVGTTFSYVGGFHQVTLPTPVGRIPASLFGKAPGGDPYLMHATMYSRIPPVATDYLAVKTPVGNYRRLWTPSPGNTRAALVRPDDTLEFLFAAVDDMYLELLLEPLAATNEFGPVLLDLLREESRENVENPAPTAEIVTSATMSVPLWSGVLRIICTNGAAINLNLPDASTTRLGNLLIVEVRGTGAVNIAPTLGQFINNAASVAPSTAAYVRGGGINWTAVMV